MKSITLFTILNFWSLNIMSQALNNDVFSVNLPTGAVKISTEKFQTFLKKNPRYSKVETTRKGDFYQIGNAAVLNIYGSIGNAPSDQLEKIKKGLEGMYSMLGYPKNYKSVIKPINNYHILIENYNDGVIEYYNFYAFNKENTKALTGNMEFNSSEKSKNSENFGKMLNSLKFK